MPRVTAEQKRQKKIDRVLNGTERRPGGFRALQVGKCLKKTAVKLQQAIRAESGASLKRKTVWIDGEVVSLVAGPGQCRCVTCGVTHRWDSGKIHAGHFVPGRRASIVLEERNIHPQCDVCNTHGGGMRIEYLAVMLAVYGQDVVDELERLEKTSVTWDREVLAGIYVDSMARTAAAKERMSE